MKALAACGAGNTVGTNASRSLHRLIQRQGRTLPVQVQSVTVPVRIVSKGRPGKTDMPFPVIKPSAWLEYSLNVGGEAFLGGHSLIDEEGAYRSMFLKFWKDYQALHPECELFHRCVPLCVHGDEGRGKCRRPIMILSVQPIIGPKGPNYVNTSGYLGLIFALISYNPKSNTRSLWQALTDNPNVVQCDPLRTLLRRSHLGHVVG